MSKHELYHHGIKGQKWGDRRFQYEDGSLTPEGRERYGYGNSNSLKSRQKNVVSGNLSQIKKGEKINSISNIKSEEAYQKRLGYTEYSPDDKDFDDSNYKESNRVGDTDFFSFKRPDGTQVLLEEDMKWVFPANANIEEEVKKLEDKFKKEQEIRWNQHKTDAKIDKMADEVIKGKWGNGEDRKRALGASYNDIQKRVNEKMAKHSDTEEDILIHYGILGQKWGDRRFQNPDGTYTEEGKRRRREDTSKYSDDYRRYSELTRKSSKELTTKELEEINRRDNAQNTYNRNHYSNKGKEWVNKLGSKVMEKSSEAIAVAIVTAGTIYVKKALKRG